MRRFSILSLILVLAATALWAAGKDTPKAAETRKKLKQKISVDYDNESITDVISDLKSKIKGGIGIQFDQKGGVSGNIKITYKSDDQSVEDVLAGMFKKNGLGYFVISDAGNKAYDGNLFIKQGKERGYPIGAEPDKAVMEAEKKDTDKTADKDKGKGKTGGKDKAEAKDKAADKEKPETKDKPPEDDAEKAEKDAERKYGFAEVLAKEGKTAKAKERLEDILKKYPTTKAAEKAKELLKTIDQ